MVVVLDASVAIPWVVAHPLQAVATSVRARLVGARFLAPAIWSLEVINVLLKYQRLGDLSPTQVHACLDALASLDVALDAPSPLHADSRIITLAMRSGLSAYDAAYLDLALREHLPLVTLDKKLQVAANKHGAIVFEA
jgi:predicted nucleic acid-binding protein